MPGSALARQVNQRLNAGKAGGTNIETVRKLREHYESHHNSKPVKDGHLVYRLCQKMGIKQAQFDRFKNDQFKLDTIDIEPSENNNSTKLTLVR